MSTIPGYQILKRPLILTEKGNAAKEAHNQYQFEVATKSTKDEIRTAVQTQFPEVKVLAVRTMIVRGRDKRMGRGYAKTLNWKKAIVTLREGDKIEFFEAF